MSLLVTGWVAIDEIHTPFATVENFIGGSATAAAIGAAFFTDVRLLAAVGDDFPDDMRAILDRPGVDLTGLQRVPGGLTSRWGGRYHYDMNTRDTLYTELGVNATWQPAWPAGWEHSSTVFLAAGDPVLQRDMLRRLVKPRATMVDTIKFFIDSQRDELLTTFAEATFVSVNEGEARELAATPSIAKAGRTLRASGPEGVVVKLGEYGAAFVGNQEYFVAPGYPLEEVVDPTGAGDAFAGGFMGYLDSVPAITPGEIRRAMVYGSTVASFQVEGFGPQRLLSLTRDEIDARYAEFRKLTYFEGGE